MQPGNSAGHNCRYKVGIRDKEQDKQGGENETGRKGQPARDFFSPDGGKNGSNVESAKK